MMKHQIIFLYSILNNAGAMFSYIISTNWEALKRSEWWNGPSKDAILYSNLAYASQITDSLNFSQMGVRLS